MLDDIKDKIQKLLNLATSDNEHEAAAAMKKATALMNKWNLDTDTVTGQKLEVRPYEFPFASWTFVLKLLVQELCQVTDLEIVFQNGSKKFSCGAKLYISGRPRDIDNYIYLFEFIRVKVTKESQKYKLSIRKSGTSQRNSQATESFRIGFVEKIAEKLITNKTNFFTENKGLISIDSEVKKKEAKDFLMDHFQDENLRKPKESTKKVGTDHMAAGSAVANDIDLNVAINGKKQEQIGNEK